MVQEIRYTSIRRVLDNLLDHPMLQGLTLEQGVRYALRFMSLFGFPRFYQDRIDEVEIHDFRGMLPCDLVSIIQVRDKASGICLRSMTDSFNPGLLPTPTPPSCPSPDKHGHIHHHPHPLHHPHRNWYIPPLHENVGELSFKTQGRVIYTSFPEGIVEISYRSIPVDEDGFPMVIDNEVYLGALEAYIKKQVFTIKFDQGKIAAGVLQNAQTDYAVLAHELQTEFTTPSPSEVESYTRYFNSLIPRVREFDHSFKNLGDREYLRNH